MQRKQLNEKFAWFFLHQITGHKFEAIQSHSVCCISIFSYWKMKFRKCALYLDLKMQFLLDIVLSLSVCSTDKIRQDQFSANGFCSFIDFDLQNVPIVIFHIGHTLDHIFHSIQYVSQSSFVTHSKYWHL